MQESAGSSLVLLHGFLGTPSMWSSMLSLLAHDGAVHALSLPGHGPSPVVSEGASFVEIADAFAMRLPADGPVVLVGYSMGARLALTLLSRHPESFAGALLIGGDPGLSDAGERRARASWDVSQAEAIEREGLGNFAERWAELPLFASQRLLPEETRAAQQQERCSHETHAAAWAMRALGLGVMPNLWPSLARLACPVVVLTGALDHKFTAIGHKMTEASRMVRHIVVEGAGHNVVLERPQQTAQALRLLLSTVKAAGPRAESPTVHVGRSADLTEESP